jgi:hypothetical protein
VLASNGKHVTLAVGESVHQYGRNLYLRRLDHAGVEILQHHRLVSSDADGIRPANVFAHELERTVAANALVLVQGRVPDDRLAPALRAAGLEVEKSGDCLSPRSLEEAVLEGTLAAQLLCARLSAPS